MMTQFVQDYLTFLACVALPMPPMITWLLVIAFNVCNYLHHSHLLTWTLRDFNVQFPLHSHCLVGHSLPSLVPLVCSMLVALGVVLLAHHFRRQLFLVQRFEDHQAALRIEQLKAEKQRLEYERLMVEQSSHRLSRHLMSRHAGGGGEVAKELLHVCDSIDPSDSAA